MYIYMYNTDMYIYLYKTDIISGSITLGNLGGYLK